jgi:hypothetical protein
MTAMLAISSNIFMVQDARAQQPRRLPQPTGEALIRPDFITPLPCRLCVEPGLMGTQANVHFSNSPLNTDWNGTVSNVVEMPSATNTLSWNNPGRYNIDLQYNKVRIEFARNAGAYGPLAQFKFTLNPTAIRACGPVKIVGSTISTNRPDAASYVTSQSSFDSTTNTVTISYGNQGQGFEDWRKGDWIEAQLSFECQTPPNVPPVSTCCPPVNKQMVKGMFKHEGNAAGNYTMSLDTTSPATNSFVTGLNAYFTYLKTVCPQTVGFKAEFFTGPVAAPTTVGGAAGPLTGPNALTPKSSITVTSPQTSPLTIGALNNALSASGMNSLPYINGQYHRTSVKIVGINAVGEPVNCGFNAQECQVDDTFGFIFATTERRSDGSTPYTD